MCRAYERHCIEDPEKRRARQKASYHNRKNGGTAVIGPGSSVVDNPAPDTGAVAESDHETDTRGKFLNQIYGLNLPDDYAGGNPTDQQLADTVEAVSQLISVSRGDMYAKDNKGFPVPTAEGEKTVEAVQYLGSMIEARAEALYKQKIVTSEVPKNLLGESEYGPFSSPDQYNQHILNRANQITQELNGIAHEIRETARNNNIAMYQTLKSRWEKLHKEYKKYAAERVKVHVGVSAYSAHKVRLKSEARREALAQIRSMGFRGKNPITSINIAQSHKTSLQRLNKAVQYYPSSWLARDTAGNQSELVVRGSGKRANYTQVYYRDGSFAYAQLTTDKDDDSALEPGISTTIHEYGHRQEHVTPEVNEICQTFLAMRTGGMERDGLQPLYEHKNRRKTVQTPLHADEIAPSTRRTRVEWSRPDSFVSPYTGRDYGRYNNSEVFTTGMQGVFAGNFGGLEGQGQYKADTGHKNLILGILASVK